MPNPTPAPEPAKLLSAERLEQLRVRNDMATPDGLMSHDVRDLFQHIAALEQLAARPSPEVEELVAAIESHPDVQFVLKKPVGDGVGASRRVLAALAAIQKGGAQ